MVGITHIEGINKRALKQVNLSILIGKLCISKFKFGQQQNIIELFETEARKRKLWEA